MASFEDLDGLRRRNKELLQKLKDRTERLQRRHLDCERNRLENGSPEFVLERAPLLYSPGKVLEVSDALIDLSVEDKSPKVARKALCQQINIMKTPQRPEFQRDGEAGRPPEHDVILQDRGKSHLRVRFNPKPTMQPGVAQDTEQSQVKFPPGDDEPESVCESERRRVQPLLGYDWIAGLLDAENSLTERSELFFTELRTFRQVNKDECVHGACGLPVGLLASSLKDEVTNHEQTPDIHQCTFCYRINNRLFATPLDGRAACPVCKMPKEKHPHTEEEPAFIRVSVPLATLLPAYRYRAHRRCSFDPSDSLGLPSHCLSGWTNTSMGAGSEMSSLDLRSSMEIRPNTGTVPSDQLDRSGSRAPGRQLSDRLMDVSHLARYQFQRLDATRNPNKSAR